VAWYLGHSLLLRELSQVAREREERTRHAACKLARQCRTESTSIPTWGSCSANVEAGIYPLPVDHDGSLFALIRRSRIFFDDLPNIHRRREGRAYSEALNETTRGTRPRYYLQNFHYQSGGWLTEKSAELYDTQVEILFNGSANAIRRQALPQLHEVFAGPTQAEGYRYRLRYRTIHRGAGTIAIMPNDTDAYPKDSFDNMKRFSAQHDFTFPYVIDRTQDVARAYGAQCTPDFFGFNSKDELQYRGRLDASRTKPVSNARRDLYEAMKQVVDTGHGPKEQFTSMGCSIKWKH
jgi:hypothetical protein